MSVRATATGVCLAAAFGMALGFTACGTSDDDRDAGVADAADLSDAADDTDAGESDAGDLDAGDADAGDADAGDADGGVALSPILPECEGGTGDAEVCWKEWLKVVGTVDFAPVERGALGAGPWPVTDFEQLNGGVGLERRVIGVGVDTGQNQYAITRDALFIRRAGETQFTRYGRGTSGLRDYPMGSIAGGGPGQAYLGLIGIGDQETDPEEIRKSGDVQALTLDASGFTAVTWDTHNSNSPVSGKFDHSRQIYEIHVPRRGPAAGEVFLGTGHGVVRYQGERYVDHLHIETFVGTSQRFGNTKAMVVSDDGTMWYGNDFAFGGKRWTPRLFEWNEGRWLFPTWAFGSKEDRDHYEGIGVDSTGHVVWVLGREHGMVRMTIAANGRSAKLDRISVPDSFTRDLVVDLDDTVWVGSDSGLHHYDPATDNWTRISEVPGGVEDLFLDDTVTPRALYIAHSQGVTVYRGP